jgi:hypothetical protein
MKRYIFAIVCCFVAVITYAECTTLTGSSVEISRWYDSYTPVVGGEMECWTIELEGDGPYQIRYNVDLDQFMAIDNVCIYEIENDGTLGLLTAFSSVTTSGAVVTYSKKLKVEYYGYTGKLTEDFFDGFQLYFEKASHEYVTAHDYYILGRLGVGTTNPQTTLHVNGGIYGGESFGATKLQSRIGYITIGTHSAERNNMQFTTDRRQFRFDKPLLSQAGVFGSTTNSLQLTTNDSVCITIQNGNVGIGTMTPQEKLHINGAIRGGGANGEVTLKGDSGYVTIGASNLAMEFVTDKSQFVFNKPIYNQSGVYNVQNSNMLFNINGTNRMLIQNNGNIGIGTASPAYKLDVNGTIRANEIIVNTTGADFVFAEDYQLRPLSEVKAFIKENKHLPEIKSAQEMQENGIGVNELQTQLLQKIEELTLYIIHQEERINALEAELNK